MAEINSCVVPLLDLRAEYEPLRRQLRAFIERIRTQGEPGVSPASVLAVTETLEAISSSIRLRGAPQQVEAS